MSDFEYLSVLIAIIVGIGFAHLLLSIGRIVGETKRHNVHVAQLIWTFNILLMLVTFWWWAISLRELEEWVYLQLVFLLFDVSLWCLLAAILYPVNIPDEFDLGAYFERKRRPFFIILIVLSFADPMTASILGTEHLLELGLGYWHWIATCFFGGFAALRYSNERFQTAFAVYWALALIGFAISWQFSVG
jgi:hypothetical protein